VRFDVVLLDANLRQMLVCMRSLGRAGHSIAALTWLPARMTPATASRWCTASHRVADVAADADRFVDDVLAFLRRHSCGVLVPAHDGTIAAFRRRRAELEREVALALPSEPALRAAVDKSLTLEVAARLGVAVPRGGYVSSPAEVPGVLEAVGLPAVVKPLESWADAGPAPVRLRCREVVRAEEAVAAVERICAAGGRAVLQEWAPGAREAASFLYQDGIFRAEFAQVAYRMDPPIGGASVLRESIPVAPDVGQSGRALVRAIGLEGYSEVEFRRDASGRPLLMEVNPRLSASVEVAVRAGVDFPRLLYMWARGETVEGVPTYRIGQRMRWLGGDLHWLASALVAPGRPDAPTRLRALALFTRDFLRRSSYDYLDMHDLRPAWVAARSYTRDVLAEGPGGLARRATAFRRRAA
jgi:predicted ATP-grasp superfamily ATP-dependent carboligase